MALFSQDQVNNWFAANPNATPEFVAQTVQGLGGLEANAGLAGMIGQHYGTDANTITSNYNTLTAPPPASVSGIASLGVGNAAQATPDVMQPAATTPPPVLPPPTISPLQKSVDQWKINNPTATPQQVANAIAANGGLTPEMAQAVANTYSTDVNTITSGYDRLNPYSQMATSYANKDYTGLNSLINQSGLNTGQIQQHFGLTDDQLAQARGLGVNLNYTTPEIQSLVNSTLASKTLTPFEQINRILETGQQYGFGEEDLAKLYGKDKVSNALSTYKGGINDFLTQTLAKDTGTTMSEVGEIHRAAQKYGMTPAEIAKYGGIDPQTAQTYFDLYDKGLGTLVSSLNDPKVTDVQKTATLLSAAQTYGTTDEELAKASNGKYTTAEVKAYLDPVRNVPKNFQSIMNDPNASAADITQFVNDAKKDPRAAGIYGAALDQLTPDPAYLALRDIKNGTGNTAQNYNSFLTTAKSTPELAAKYAPQIAQVEKIQSTISRAVGKDYGGKEAPWMYEMFAGLNQKDVAKAPAQLEFTPAKTDIAQGVDENNNVYSYTRTLSPAQPKGEGVTPIYGPSIDGDSEIIGYKQPIKSKSFTENYYGEPPLVATYDANGKRTGFESGARIYTSDPNWIGAKWDASGKAQPHAERTSGSGIRGAVNDIMSDPIMGSVANIAASYFGGPLGVAALAAVQGVPPEEILKRAVISMAANEVGGQVSGSTAGSLGEFGSQAAGQFTGNAAAGILSGQDLDTNGLLVSSLVNAGLNTGGKDLLGLAGLDKLGAAQPYVNNVLSGAVSGAVTGKDQDIAKTITNTALKEAMKSGKETLKTAAKS